MKKSQPKFNHIMLDLETLDNVSTAVIVSIGAVRFDLNCRLVSSHESHEFYVSIDPSDCQKFGLTIGASTVEWWLTQSPMAQSVFNNPESVPLKTALMCFSKFVERVDGSTIWGNGSMFDNAILKNAYTATGLKIPWSYRNDLCYRTMRKMFPKSEPAIHCPSLEHNALYDARTQAHSLIAIFKDVQKKWEKL